MGSDPPASPGVSPSTPCPLDDRGALAADAPCVACGYNLRGLTPAGRCPECGAPVAQSVCEPNLRCAPPEWVNRIRSGLQMLLVALLSLPVACLLSLGAGAAGPAVCTVSLLGVAAAGVTAVMQLTTRRPDSGRAHLGIDARLCAVCWLSLTPILLFGLSGHTQITLLALIIYLGAFGAAWLTCLRHLASLFELAKPRLTATPRLLSNLSIAALLFVLLGLCFMLPSTHMYGPPVIEVALVAVGGVLAIVVWFAAIVWAIRAGRFVAREAAIATAWREASATRVTP